MLCFGWYFTWRYDVKSLRLRLQGLGAGFVIQPKEFKLQSSHESGVPCIEKVGLELLSESPMLKADADHLRILYLQNGRLLRFQPLRDVLQVPLGFPKSWRKHSLLPPCSGSASSGSFFCRRLRKAPRSPTPACWSKEQRFRGLLSFTASSPTSSSDSFDS